MNTLSNEHLTIKSKKAGAELTSVVCNKTKKEYLWQADSNFWGRHSPILFPIVGGLWNGKFQHNGAEYEMSQHGFARDVDFELIKKTSSEVQYKLISTNDTLSIYPFAFELIVSYRLSENNIEVLWQVKNTGNIDMHFQIGAHPAFNYPDFEDGVKDNGFFSFDTKKDITYRLIGEMGCLAVEPQYSIALDDGLMTLDVETFNDDALIIEDNQIKKVSLLDKQKKTYLTLHFEAPVVGLWSPPLKNAPFVCIEPWYGRCDREDYAADLKDRDWMNHLEAGKTFKSSYTIEIEI